MTVWTGTALLGNPMMQQCPREPAPPASQAAQKLPRPPGGSLRKGAGTQELSLNPGEHTLSGAGEVPETMCASPVGGGRTRH